MKDNKYGILLAVSSLPSRHGIGDFGESAFHFIDWLKNQGYRYWQVLPINPLGPCYSPYMSTCSSAIEYRYISLDELTEEGLLKHVPNFHEKDNRVDYYAVGEYKKEYLYRAYKAFSKAHMNALKLFMKKEDWVAAYATFEVFKWHNDNKAWNEWREIDRDYFLTHKELPEAYLDEIYFVIFMQYMAMKQWNKVLDYASKNGVEIICDMPFYVGFDGVECWLHRDQFSINPVTNQLFEVGGVGPDGFSADGQLWGSPIYNFKKMKENHYALLVDRIGHLLKRCHYLRIDHFRAFDTYYVIPAGEETARNGEWIIGPRDEFFYELYRKYPNAQGHLIAEDLGELRPEVWELRDMLNLPGMFVGEFTLLDPNAFSNTHQLVYSGTHDNETLWGWFSSLSEEQKAVLKAKVKNEDGEELYDDMVKYLFTIPSLFTIFPLQDVLKYDNSCRMNAPGTISEKNWTWKLRDFGFIYKIKYPVKAWKI